MRRPVCLVFAGLGRLHYTPPNSLNFRSTSAIKYFSRTRAFSSKSSRLGPWLAGDPLMDQGKERVYESFVSQRRQQTFHLRPSGDKALEEERFPLSSLDLFNTQNYSTHALIFKTEDSNRQIIVETLKRGLEAALGQCRHIAGSVEKKEDKNERGDFSIVKRANSTVKFVVQWLDGPEDDYPSYSDLEKARFSAESLGDPARLTIEGMTMACRRPPDSSPVVAAFQLTFIPGGLIFTVHKHHAALDIAGTTSLVHQIAENCYSILKGTPPPSWDESLMDRSRFITRVAEEELIDAPPPPGRHADWHPCSWLLFHLPKSKAAELKRLATPYDGGWISTHDALTALLWRVVSRNRAPIYRPDLTLPAPFFEAINMRDRLTPKLHARYQGNCLSAGQSLTQPNPLTLAEVISDAPLSRIATFIRQVTTSATQETLENTLQLLAPFRDKWVLHPRLDALPPMSFVMTDWRGAQMCEADFGFGRPAAFRQLSDVVVENMAIIYPPLKLDGESDQGVEVMIPFEKHALDVLFEDADMKHFFEFRGFEACPP